MTALGDPTRQAIFERLVERPRPVGELAGELPVTRPAVSQHLKVLKDAGLVQDRREGRWSYYSLVPETLAVAHDVVRALATEKRARQPLKVFGACCQ